MRILIIEDDREIRRSIKASLEHESFVVDEATNGDRGSYTARINDYDLIILDFMMPKKNGYEVCQEIRSAGKTVPIIMVSVRARVEDKVEILNCGADDYLTKPFSFYELLARIRALLRRPQGLEPRILALDDLFVDTIRQRVNRGERQIYLTRKEFSLLEYLLKHQGGVVSRGMIMEHVWNADSDPFSNTIEAHILNLRKKIELRNSPKLIHTVPGRGYIMDIEREYEME